MTDQLGIPLSIGDKIIYTTGAQSYTALMLGTILEIEDNRAMIRTDSNRKATNWRNKYEVLSIQYHHVMLEHVQQNSPELFV